MASRWKETREFSFKTEEAAQLEEARAMFEMLMDKGFNKVANYRAKPLTEIWVAASKENTAFFEGRAKGYQEAMEDIMRSVANYLVAAQKYYERR